MARFFPMVVVTALVLGGCSPFIAPITANFTGGYGGVRETIHLEPTEIPDHVAPNACIKIDAASENPELVVFRDRLRALIGKPISPCQGQVHVEIESTVLIADAAGMICQVTIIANDGEVVLSSRLRAGVTSSRNRDGLDDQLFAAVAKRITRIL